MTDLEKARECLRRSGECYGCNGAGMVGNDYYMPRRTCEICDGRGIRAIDPEALDTVLDHLFERIDALETELNARVNPAQSTLVSKT